MTNDKILDAMKAARRRRVAQEIADALRASGMSRKEFALAMHRLPSEVTKWLSGRHNFTCDLLEEISIVLGARISGAEDVLQDRRSVVDGYGPSVNAEDGVAELESPSGYEICIELPGDAASALSYKAAHSAMTLREYVMDLLLRDSKASGLTAMDFCGILEESYPTVEELRAMRTSNSFPELP